MMLALKGMSPKVDKKRPVHFNLKFTAECSQAAARVALC